MNCPDCGSKMIELFTSAVCDHCDSAAVVESAVETDWFTPSWALYLNYGVCTPYEVYKQWGIKVEK